MAGQAMKLSTFSGADEFLLRAQAWLERSEAGNSLMLGIALRLKRFPDRIEKAPYLVVVEDEREIVAVASMTPPWNLIVASDKEDCSAALGMIASDLAARHWDVPGTIGRAQVSGEFAKIWTAVAGRKRQVIRNERLFELRQVNQVAYSRGRMRTANETDIELVAQWAEEFQAEALGDQNVAEIPSMIHNRISDRDIYLWEDGKPVAMAARTRPTPHGISISLVYTPPEQRRHGYATSLVARLSQSLLDSGYKYCALFTDLANPTSNHIYQEIGYKPVCDFNEYRFE